MGMSRNYRDLFCWQKAMDLVEDVYHTSSHWPGDERFGLTSQARRSAVSVPSNIAEGEGRNGDLEFIRFLNIAHGSLRELETQLLISRRLEMTSPSDLDRLMEKAAEVGRLTKGLIRQLKTRLP